MKRNKMVAVAGAAIGTALFFAVVLPAVLYGGYAGLLSSPPGSSALPCPPTSSRAG